MTAVEAGIMEVRESHPGPYLRLLGPVMPPCRQAFFACSGCRLMAPVPWHYDAKAVAIEASLGVRFACWRCARYGIGRAWHKDMLAEIDDRYPTRPSRYLG